MIGHDFPYLDTRDINLDWLLKNMKLIIKQWADYQEHMNRQFSDLETAFNTLKNWIDSYFDNLDVQQEINNKLDAMKASGDLSEIMQPIISDETAAWLAAHITQPTTPAIDSSLTVAGAAADAKAAGDAISDVNKSLESLREYTHDFTQGNLVDFTTCTIGQYVNMSGTIGTAQGYIVTDYIPVSANTVLAIYHGDNATVHGYTADKSIGTLAVNYAGAGLGTPTTGAADAYIRVSCKLEDIDKLYICNAADYITYLYISRQLLSDNSILAKTGIIRSASDVPDINSLGTSIYEIQVLNLSTDIPANLPWPKWLGDGIGLLITVGKANTNGTQQMLETSCGRYYRQRKNNVWSAWEGTNVLIKVYPRGSSSAYMTNLTEAIGYAVKFNNATVHVIGSGTFDLSSEFTELYGSDFFTTADFTQTVNKGIMLSNNVVVDADVGTTVIFDGTNYSNVVQDQFSIFNFLLGQSEKGFTLKNITAIATNCRYVVHDDPGSLNLGYNNRYINCDFKKISTLENSSRACIGGGLGRNGAIDIDSCIFDFDGGQNDTAVSYHNNASLRAQKSSITIKNSYFKNGTIYIRSIMTPANKSDVILTNNNVQTQIWIASLPLASGFDGFNVYSWNNITRS